MSVRIVFVKATHVKRSDFARLVAGPVVEHVWSTVRKPFQDESTASRASVERWSYTQFDHLWSAMSAGVQP